MERIERTIKIGLASLLVVMMMALGGLAVTTGVLDGGISTLSAAAHTTSTQNQRGHQTAQTMPCTSSARACSVVEYQ